MGVQTPIGPAGLYDAAIDVLREKGKDELLGVELRNQANRLAARAFYAAYKADILTFGALAAKKSELPRLIPDEDQRAVLQKAAKQLV